MANLCLGHGARLLATAGSGKAPISSCSARPAEERVISPPSGWRWSKTAGACCSCAPPIWCNACKSPAANSRSKAPSPSSTNTMRRALWRVLRTPQANQSDLEATNVTYRDHHLQRLHLTRVTLAIPVGFDISAGQLDIACRQTGNFAADCPRQEQARLLDP